MGKPFQDLNIAGQFHIYVLFHELGHCVDDSRRKDFHEITFDPNAPFEQAATYNGRIIRGEYAACFFAASRMTAELYRYLEDGFLDNFSQVASWIKRPGLELKQQAGVIWVQMAEYAKLAGHRAGNPSLTSTIDLGAFRSPFSEFETTLTTDWMDYPNWEFEPPETYRENWAKLCAKCGVKL
jgi:hypothetical protein